MSSKHKKRYNNRLALSMKSPIKKVDRLFYEQQKEPDREGRVTEKVDEEYEEVLRKEQEQKLIDEAMDVETEDSEDPDDVEALDRTISLNVSMNRSGTVRAAPSINEIAIQTDPIEVERKKLRINKRVYAEDIKNTCAILSSTCALSTEMSQEVVQVVRKNMYGHDT